ncbi:MAG: M20/M25/M40 family metallo-hydrolase, partial [Anaerolineales bacterium]|nr:M20/M25/M40 family metallo-hydrolase [Anaerolineales bacterium]
MPYTAIYSYLQTHLEEMLAFLGGLVRAESPSTDPAAQTAVQAPLTAALEDLAYTVQHVPGRRSGGHLLATPAAADPAAPRQLLLAHTDTVWPLGTLAAMPLARDGRSLRGPGVFDMKGSLAMLVFVLRALRHLELTPAVTPVLLLNSDEEIGSHESRPAIEQQARQACRALVLEPAFGPDGRLKTARKGVGRFAVTITGQAAHAGIEPEKGASAILELAAVIQQLHALNDLPRGVSVNVGLVSGGVLTNVVAPHARADVDLRAPTQADAARLDAAVRALRPTTPGTTLAVSGGFERPPLERTPANQA